MSTTTPSPTTATSTAPSPSTQPFTITPARTPSDLSTAHALFTAYAQSLDLDLSFQNFSAELSSLPGAYTPSSGGELLIAYTTPSSPDIPPTALGCVALRPLGGKLCEMKRLYTTPAARGVGVGRALVRAVVRAARDLGYDGVRLDTLPSMATAQALYRSLGFRDVDKYCDNPVEGVRWLGLDFEVENEGVGMRVGLKG